MHIGFTGTQEGMSVEQRVIFLQVMRELTPVFSFHHGDCVGADEQAHGIVSATGIIPTLHPPSDPSKRAYCAPTSRPTKPYLERNRDIVDETNVLIATPAGPEVRRSGTWSTVRYARKQGKPVTIIMPDGSRKV